MKRIVVLVGALDTKGTEFAFVRDVIEGRGLRTLTVDFGVLGEPAFAPDVPRESVALAGGGDLVNLRAAGHKDRAMQTMAAGLAVVVRRLYDDGQLDGVLGMGGTGSTSIAATAMRTLPIGVPKVLVSTVGGGNVTAYTGGKDITFIPSIVDVAGINRVSRILFARAAGAVAGMVETDVPAGRDEQPLVAASMFGNTTQAVDRARSRLAAAGFETLVFHATGIGGRTMDSLIADGVFAGSLDLTTTELADHVCGGVFDAGAERGQAASRAGVPAVLAPGCVDMANFGALETVPARFRGRLLYEWNPNVTLLRTDPGENRRIGRMLADAANAASGPVAVLLPLRGLSMLDSHGQPFWDPKADEACFAAIRSALRPEIHLEALDANINDPPFADRAVELLLSMVGRAAAAGA